MQLSWLTTRQNAVLLQGLDCNVRIVAWEDRELLYRDQYDLVINLEDTIDVAMALRNLSSGQWFGAYARNDRLCYTDDSHGWFDMSLISSYGREEADRLKLRNRRSYQELVFEGLGFSFRGEEYLLPAPVDTGFVGDVAVAAEAGPVWPMKKWAHYGQLKQRLEEQGLIVNVLPRRGSLLEHLGDIYGHKCLVGGDTLPMHLALGAGKHSVTLFNCTSPWEIYDYGLQIKLVSPLLEQFFYSRAYDVRATTAITLEEVVETVTTTVRKSRQKQLVAQGVSDEQLL
ncbi:MAG: hypothetical protein DLM52_00070 [Chthoniobacterales bacterium]|nr:MAG: hypothetical protein DLM52_00070 [Chthoniobacterales bacterium]